MKVSKTSPVSISTSAKGASELAKRRPTITVSLQPCRVMSAQMFAKTFRGGGSAEVHSLNLSHLMLQTNTTPMNIQTTV